MYFYNMQAVLSHQSKLFCHINLADHSKSGCGYIVNLTVRELAATLTIADSCMKEINIDSTGK